ncbi:tetratricopeptide repeat protein [uncultured Porticoccus sp.]|uniref:tetratricopeptide repeat protein n=1 Tax=uncultured Porticoccus sp. TaxID=1256050 RepID=UPI0030DCDE58
MIKTKLAGLLAVTILFSAGCTGIGSQNRYSEVKPLSSVVITTSAAAEQGDAEAQYKMGYISYTGAGVEQNYSEALRWYRLAADQGHVTATNNLGVMYRNGEGVPQNNTEAVKWYRLAAEQGFAQAQYNLGFMYRNGEGVPQNNTEAVKWYRLAAEQGHKNAKNNLGDMYANSESDTQNNAKAVKRYRGVASDDKTCQNYGFKPGQEGYSYCRMQIDMAKKEAQTAEARYQRELAAYKQQAADLKQKQDRERRGRKLELWLRLLGGQPPLEAVNSLGTGAPITRPTRPSSHHRYRLPNGRTMTCTTTGSHTNCH